MYHGKLKESRDEDRGERILSGSPGVYFHKDDTAAKAENYVRFVPLFKDGTFWASKWEVRVNRDERVIVPRKTDQWVQSASSVRLIALWLCGRTANELENSTEVALSWQPEQEANPLLFNP